MASRVGEVAPRGASARSRWNASGSSASVAWQRLSIFRASPRKRNTALCPPRALGVKELDYHFALRPSARQRRAVRIVAALPALPAAPADGFHGSRLHRLWSAQPVTPGRGSGRRRGAPAHAGRGVHGLTAGGAHLPKVVATAHVWALVGVSQTELRSRSAAGFGAARSLPRSVARPGLRPGRARGAHAGASA
jgi:hypothetical protein